MTAHLDHLVIAARTLEEGRAWLEGRLGVTMQAGGEHAAFGTHNLLLSLGPSAYLEVIAVNPAAPAPSRPRWFGLDTPDLTRKLDAGPALIHWVARTAQPPADALELSRGENRWALTVPPDGSLPLGGVAPSLIYWHTPPPPTRLPDAGVRLATLRLGTPEPQPLRQLLDQLGFVGEVEVQEAPSPELWAALEVSGERVEL